MSGSTEHGPAYALRRRLGSGERSENMGSSLFRERWVEMAGSCCVNKKMGKTLIFQRWVWLT
jgi:hypothetical protein